MIANGLELTRFLCQQAQNSGFARAGVVIVLDNDGSLHKSEFGLMMTDQAVEENVIQMVPADEEAPPEGEPEEAEETADDE